MKYFRFSAESKGFSTTWRIEDAEEDELEVEADDATAFRAVAARINLLAQDRPDIQFAAKDVCRRGTLTRGGSGCKRRLRTRSRGQGKRRL